MLGSILVNGHFHGWNWEAIPNLGHTPELANAILAIATTSNPSDIDHPQYDGCEDSTLGFPA